MNKIRNIIREQLENLFEQMDGGILDGAMADLQDQITSNIENLESLEKSTDQDIKNSENELKGQKQLKGQLPTQNPERQGLERQIPATEKELEKKRKGVDSIKKAQEDFKKAQQELQKQQAQIKQSSSKEDGNSEILPSLESPI